MGTIYWNLVLSITHQKNMKAFVIFSTLLALAAADQHSHQSFKQGNAPAVSTSISRPHGEYHATVHSQPAATPDEVHQYHNEEKYVAGVHAPSHDRALDLNHANHAPIHGNIHGNHANFNGNHANFNGNHANFHGNHANFNGNHANINGNHANIHGNHALTHTIHRDSINHAHSQTHPT